MGLVGGVVVSDGVHVGAGGVEEAKVHVCQGSETWAALAHLR
jgi:hypothetical protein